MLAGTVVFLSDTDAPSAAFPDAVIVRVLPLFESDTFPLAELAVNCDKTPLLSVTVAEYFLVPLSYLRVMGLLLAETCDGFVKDGIVEWEFIAAIILLYTDSAGLPFMPATG